MRKLIWSIDKKHKVFYLIIEGRKIGFYLSNRLAKTFFSYLGQGVMVDFAVYDSYKKIGNQNCIQVAYFNQIISLNPYRVYYDLFALRQEMKSVLANNQYYLFIDFEMTMPGYLPEQFQAEIIQVGYVLAKAQGEIEHAEGYYVLPKDAKTLSKRTKKFLKLDEEKFFEEALPFQTFYDKLQNIIKTYRPKFVIWGKNDLTALNASYKMHRKKRLTTDKQFIDLLKLHKDYYNLKDDLGLFKAYKAYYQKDEIQDHNAMDDALMTKYVFDSFVEQMKFI